MLPAERCATATLSAIYMLRMLGLFIVLPVFSLFASEYAHSTPFLVGLAIGIYGLFQALLQIPFGMMSDRFGRKVMITIGLILLVVGSIVAATAESIYVVILGRALQGAGAISAVLLALAADLTRDEQRTKIMDWLCVHFGAYARAVADSLVFDRITILDYGGGRGFGAAAATHTGARPRHPDAPR